MTGNSVQTVKASERMSVRDSPCISVKKEMKTLHNHKAKRSNTSCRRGMKKEETMTLMSSKENYYG